MKRGERRIECTHTDRVLQFPASEIARESPQWFLDQGEGRLQAEGVEVRRRDEQKQLGAKP